jgi:hypothetical protein
MSCGKDPLSSFSITEKPISRDEWDDDEDAACADLSLGSLCFSGADTEKSHPMRKDFFAGTMSMSLKSLAALSTRLSQV